MSPRAEKFSVRMLWNSGFTWNSGPLRIGLWQYHPFLVLGCLQKVFRFGVLEEKWPKNLNLVHGKTETTAVGYRLLGSHVVVVPMVGSCVIPKWTGSVRKLLTKK